MENIAQPLLLIPLLLLFSSQILAWVSRRKTNPQGLPYPPGPKRYPIIGNLLDLPSTYLWLRFAEWSKKYGDIVHFELFGQHYFVLNSRETCADILDKRSVNYSDRPHSTMMNDLMKFSKFTSMLQYGPLWRQHRRILRQHLYGDAAAKHIPKQLLEARRTLLKLIESPYEFRAHLKLSFAASILNIVYGIDAYDPSNKEYLHHCETCMEAALLAMSLGAFVVDLLPFLKYIPSWFPGANFQRLAKYYSEAGVKLRNRPAEFVEKALESDVACDHESIYAELYKRSLAGEDKDSEIEVARYTTATAFAGGADTTVSTLHLLLLVMGRYPEVQAKAQAQLDEVVGEGRLPEFSDISRLPYIQAIVKELFRWQPVSPIGVPHKATKDDSYRGYHIPKGSIIIGNVWGILHNEEIYPEPYAFRPERFLNSDGNLNPNILDPSTVSFGFGRRICPGLHFAINGALIMTASLLHVFNIHSEPEVEFSDQENASELIMTSGVVSYPRNFQCGLKPRSVEMATLVRRYAEQAKELHG